MRATHISSTQHPSRPAWTDVFTAIKSLPALPLEENQLKDGSLDSNFTESAQRKALRSPSFSQAAISMTAKWLRRFPSAWKVFFIRAEGLLIVTQDIWKNAKTLSALMNQDGLSAPTQGRIWADLFLMNNGVILENETSLNLTGASWNRTIFRSIIRHALWTKYSDIIVLLFQPICFNPDLKPRLDWKLEFRAI